MIYIDLDEHKIYRKSYQDSDSASYSGTGFFLQSAKLIIDKMFEEYFMEFYQENAMKSQMTEIWKQISINIPEETVFVVKNAQQYYLTEDLHFETIPEVFFEISNTAHIVLAECFETCYSRFTDWMGNYKDWKQKEINLPTIYISERKHPDVGGVEGFFEDEKVRFERILNVSLKPKMIDSVSPKIMELYRSEILDNEPIMLIIKTDGDTIEIYSVSNELMVKKVQYLHMERQLQEIISRHVPVDSDFLANRLYNYIWMPSKWIKPYIRIETVNKNGINATLFITDRQIPIVSDLEFKKVYTFALIEHNANVYPNSPYSMCGDFISIQPVSPEEGLREMQEMNETMFQDMTCYVEYVGEKYRIHGMDPDTCKEGTWDEEDSLVYELKQGELSLMESLTLESIENGCSRIKEVARKARKEGVYAFFKVEFF